MTRAEAAAVILGTALVILAVSWALRILTGLWQVQVAYGVASTLGAGLVGGTAGRARG